nr:glycosyltransferase family 9 protein [uncultured Halomonas sp.]
MKKKAQQLEKQLKNVVFSLLHQLLTSSHKTHISQLTGIKKILLIRPNFRIGNALISTPAIDAFQQKYPNASIDFLVTDNTALLFDNLPINKLFSSSRSSLLMPWKPLLLIAQLRKEKYDLVVQLGGGGSLTGFLYAKSIDARYSMGMPNKGKSWYDITVKGKSRHAYDLPVLFSRMLGTTCRSRPILKLSDSEKTDAKKMLQSLGMILEDSKSLESFIALFVGGHLDKRCPLPFWQRLILRLEEEGIKHVVFLGPEEFRLAKPLQDTLDTCIHGSLCQPRPLRQFVAMLSHAKLLITPDSGPMHIAIALDKPTITLARSHKSDKFLLEDTMNFVLRDMSIGTVLEKTVTLLKNLEYEVV